MAVYSPTSALILAANAERLRWLERLTTADEAGTISHAQYLLARCARAKLVSPDRWHGLRSCEIDAIYCMARRRTGTATRRQDFTE